MNVKEYIKKFGLKIFLIKVIRRKFYNNYSKFGIYLSSLTEKNVTNFLKKNILSDFEKNNDNYQIFKNECIPENKIIWTMWWQGLDGAPAIVKACIRKVKSDNPHKEVIVINKNNYKKFVHLSSRVINLLKSGKISFTHFSDIYRVNLLYLYGGVWVDSTVWTTKSLNKNIYKYPFYSINLGKNVNSPSHGRWNTFFLECHAKNTIMNFVRICFDLYVKKYDIFIDYILFDYFIKLSLEYDKNRKMVNNIPINNIKVNDLLPCLNKDCNEYEEFIKSNTYVYKLTYKKRFLTKTRSRNKTIYEMIIKYK